MHGLGKEVFLLWVSFNLLQTVYVVLVNISTFVPKSGPISASLVLFLCLGKGPDRSRTARIIFVTCSVEPAIHHDHTAKQDHLHCFDPTLSIWLSLTTSARTLHVHG